MEVVHIGHQREELDIELEGEETDSGGQFRVPRRGSAWRAVEGVKADRRISKRLKGMVMIQIYMPVRNGNLGTDRTTTTNTTTKAASVCKQLGTKISKSNEGRQAKNGGVKGRDRVQRSLTERLVRSRLQDT